MTQTSYEPTTTNHVDRKYSKQHQSSQLLKLWRRWKAYALLVIMPTLLCIIYLFFFAAPQYISEARFTVRTANQSEMPSILGLLSMGGASSLANSEAYNVADYLESHDAVLALEKDISLIQLYRRPGADPLFKLWWRHPSQEQLLNYYQRMVDISFDSQSNIAILKVRAFRREDALKIAERLLELGEQRVNDFSKRAEEDTISVAENEVKRAEQRVANAQSALTNFRIKQQTLDPSKSAAAIFQIISGLEAQLAAARAELSAQSSYLSPSSPQYQALTQKISAIQQQIDNQSSLMTGNGHNTLAPLLSEYEGLSLEREFAEREYTTALASLEQARVAALKQHLFVARAVEPNLPDQSTFPKPFTFSLTIFVVLSVLYGIGWLVYVGTKEHAA